jgi:hypothetical protein
LTWSDFFATIPGMGETIVSPEEDPVNPSHREVLRTWLAREST